MIERAARGLSPLQQPARTLAGRSSVDDYDALDTQTQVGLEEASSDRLRSHGYVRQTASLSQRPAAPPRRASRTMDSELPTAGGAPRPA